MNVRVAVESDVSALAEIFRRSILAAGPARYTPEQVAAWSSFADSPIFTEFILKPHTLIAADEQGAAGFCGIILPPNEKAGHIASLYIRPDAARKGLGTTLLRNAMSRGRAAGCHAFDAEASEFSLSLFAREGFVLTEVENVERRGVMFRRYLVARKLCQSSC